MAEARRRWTIREAVETDAEAMASLIYRAFAEYAGKLAPPSGGHAETVESVRRKLASVRGALAFSAGGAEPAGCVLYEPREDHVYFSRLAVLPAERGEGAGLALITHIEAVARRRGTPRVRLGVRIALAGQRAWYERLGYRTIEYHAHEGWPEPTYALMEKAIE